MSRQVDPYIDPETGILRNRIGARTQAALDQAEGGLSVYRLVELAVHYPVRTSGDLAELCGIHRHLFQDVYEWAGNTRTVDIRKPGSQPFLPASRIDVGPRFAFDDLRADRHLRGMNRAQFIERLAHHYDTLNYAHPFRDGNGRTQRVFWSRVARDAGYHLDWQQVTAERNNQASRAAGEHSDLLPLCDMFDAITTKATRGRRPGRAALDVARPTLSIADTEATVLSHEPPQRGLLKPANGPMGDGTPGVED